MRCWIAVAAVLLVNGLASPGRAQGGAPGVDLALSAPRGAQTCTIVALDSVTMNFLCQTQGTESQYWVARSTRFLANRPGASFFDLRTGQLVQVTFHDAGRLRIADLVRVQPASP